LATLEPAYREALVLTKFEGYSLEEAATRAGVSTGAMKTRVHRALRTLQKRLRTEGLP
jgi:RNA polymerase sigma-70 factor (ECF subfamily)